MKSTHSLAALAATASLLLGAPAPAAGPKLQIPDFSHLRQKASDSVDISLDGLLLNIAKRIAREDDDEVMTLLSDIKSLRVRNFEFDSDDAYSRADIESVRKQLSAPGWSALVQSHKRDEKEDVDVFINTDGEKILGLAVVACEPRSFTIVNIVGNIDIDKFAKLEGELGIPRIETDKLSKGE